MSPLVLTKGPVPRSRKYGFVLTFWGSDVRVINRNLCRGGRLGFLRARERAGRGDDLQDRSRFFDIPQNRVLHRESEPLGPTTKH